MTTTTQTFPYSRAEPRNTVLAKVSSLQAWLSRTIEQLTSSAERRARRKREGDVARFLAANGGQFTDDMEREISRRFGNVVGQ